MEWREREMSGEEWRRRNERRRESVTRSTEEKTRAKAAENLSREVNKED